MSKSSPAGDQRPSRFHFNLNGPLGVSLIAVVLTAIFAFSALASFLGAAFGPGANEVQPGKEVAKLLDQHADNMKEYQDRFNGRSIFYKPPPKPRPYTPPPPTPVQAAPPVDDTPKVPERYMGPSPVWVMSDEATFRSPRVGADPFRLKVGEEKNGVKFISSKAPWAVRLGYAGGEYDVPLFNPGDEAKVLLASPKPNLLTPGIIPVNGTAPQMPPGSTAQGDKLPDKTEAADEGDKGDEGTDEGDDEPVEPPQ